MKTRFLLGIPGMGGIMGYKEYLGDIEVTPDLDYVISEYYKEFMGESPLSSYSIESFAKHFICVKCGKNDQEATDCENRQ